MRAARMLWAKIIELRLKILNPWHFVHMQTSGWSLTEQDPFNNVARSMEAMGAALGHTQSRHKMRLTKLTALPTDFSARIARNTPHIR